MQTAMDNQLITEALKEKVRCLNLSIGNAFSMKLIEILRRSDEPMTVTQLIIAINNRYPKLVTQSEVSLYLKRGRVAGFYKVQRRGKNRFYSINPEIFTVLESIAAV